MRWPDTLNEDETLDAVIEGASLARFGDGELNLALGGKCITQDQVAPMGAVLRSILASAGAGKCLVGIPRHVGPKEKFWSKYNRSEVTKLLSGKVYGSAFVTRLDSAPWIDRPDYWRKLKSLWQGKRVTLVRGSEKSLTAAMLSDAKEVREIICPAKNAYEDYGYIMRKIGGSATVLLCLGPTATIMAVELAQVGQHAIDLGHVGMFLRKHERGQAMVVTNEDRAFDRCA